MSLRASLLSAAGGALAFASFAAAAAAAAPGPGTWALHVLDAARFPLAQCLDGSFGAFYLSPGSGAMASTFVFHLQGGSVRPSAQSESDARRAEPRSPDCPQNSACARARLGD